MQREFIFLSFRVVSEQRKTEEWDFRFWPREKWNESQEMKEGGGGEGGEGPFFTRSLTLVPCSVLQNCMETLAWQAIFNAMFNL